MRNRFMLAALTLAAVLPTLARAQATHEREGSWEFSLGGGAMYVDGTLTHYLGMHGFANDTAPGNIAPAAVVGLGYNINNHLGFSGGTGFGVGSGVKYLSPFGDFTYTANLNATTSPFLLIGTQFTRITGNDRVTHPTWGARAGLGVRHMLSDNVALRLEGRMAFEHYAETARKTTFDPILTLGLSYFTAGRHAPQVVIAPPCPQCARARVDTIVRVQREVRVDTVLVTEPSVDQLVLRVQFETDKTALLPKSRPVLDSIAMAISANDKAAPKGQSRDAVNWFWTRLPMSTVLLPPNKSDVR